jgi:DNA polymerase I-like protein with 3'-5' exonuclease and polymerase domains
MRYAVLDIETTGLSRYKHEINYIGIGLAEDIGAPLSKTFILNTHKSGDVDRFHKIVDKLKRDRIKLIWQNGKFDTLFIEHHYGVLLPIHYDVMLMGTAYDLAASHSLDDMAEAYLGIPSWDIPLKEKIKPNSPTVEKYLEKDLSVPWELFGYFYNSLSDKQWMHYNLLLKKAYLMYRKAERKGIYFDREKHKEVKKLYQQKQKEKLTELNKVYDINWNSPAQVAKVLFEEEGLPVIKTSPKTGAPSGDAKSLRRLVAQGYDLPKKLIEYKFFYGANTKFLNKWGDYASYDGRIHPSFGLTNVVTGRTSCKDPNLQQVPRNPELRTLFTAPKGRSLIEADYSQIELRIAADYANDPTMLEIYRTGGDIHTRTAISVSGKPDPTKDDRSKAKAVNFGFLFGMLAKGFVDYAFDSYGVVFTREEANRYRDLFFQEYSRLLPWHKEIEEMCYFMGGVENRFGRFRALPDIYSSNKWERGDAVRRAINTPVQSTASDLLLFSAVEIDHKLSKEMDIYVVGTVHDAILLDCPDEYVEDATREIKKIMSNPEALDIFEVEFKIPIEADVGVGAWGSK